MKFITKDKSGQTVWLETGTSAAGLKHIIEHHADDYKNAFGISVNDIPPYINKVIKNGEIVKSIDNKKGYTKVYKYDSKYYLRERCPKAPSPMPLPGQNILFFPGKSAFPDTLFQ